MRPGAALLDLNGLLCGSGMPAGRMNDLRARLRLAYVQGAEEWSQGANGHGLTQDEFEGVLSRYRDSAT
jgi:hypothetical protein